MNTDYKILAKTLARRLNRVIDKLISHDQCGFIKGRNISTLLRTTDDMLTFLNSENIPGILVGIDFTKAFDTISKSLIQDSLKLYGFGPDFQHWIETLMANTESSIHQYGWTSEPFQTERGIRQGCPLSPLLFILAVEVLAIKIRHSNIHGISMPRNQTEHSIFKILQYADDTTLYLRDKEDLNKAIVIFGKFAQISGLKMNKRKTQALWLGSQKHKDESPHDLKWVKQIKILGVWFTADRSAREIEENWTNKVNTMKRTINQWSKRNLSIYGKIIIAKTFLISQFVYIMQSIGLPDHVLTSINRDLFRFL